MATVLKKYNGSKNAFDEVQVEESVWTAPLNPDLIHQAVVRQLNNARLGTACTKTRSEVRGGGRKPWKQKGTGRARAGSRRSPLWKGGGVSFGPKPRSFETKLNRKMAKKALQSTLSQQQGQIILLDETVLTLAKTSAFVALLQKMAIKKCDRVLVISEYQENLYRVTRNLRQVELLDPRNVGPADLLRPDHILVLESALPVLERRATL